jgi:hypothetical protein
MDVDESILGRYVSELRNANGFSLLDLRDDSMVPAQISAEISKLRDIYMKMPNEFRKKWVTINDIQ